MTTLDLCVFPGRVGFADSPAAFRALIGDADYPDPWLDSEAVAQMHTIAGKRRLYVVCLDRSLHSGRQDIAESIVHEATHVWQAVCEHIGETAPGIETGAYTMEAIVRFLFTQSGIFEEQPCAAS